MKPRNILLALLVTLLAAPTFAQPYRILVGDEPLPDGVRFVPGPYRELGRDEPNLIGERMAVGTTWYDYQANGVVSKQIALDPDGNAHLIWMKSVQDFGAGERHAYYNYVADGEPQIGGGSNIDGMARGGYNNISFNPVSGAIPVFHAIQENGQVWTFSAYDSELGEGDFTVVRAARDGGDEYIWPKGCSDRNGKVHILARHRSEDGNGNATSLAYTSSWPNDEGEWENGEMEIAGYIKGISYCVATSPVSDKVALIFNSQAYPADENARFAGGAGVAAANNNLLVFESEDGEFDFENPINVTQVLRPDPDADEDSPFYQGDTLRPMLFFDGCYDEDDNLHLVFTSVSYWERVDPNANPGYDGNRYNEKQDILWHWDRESATISFIASGMYATDGNVGNWRQNISFPSIGANEDGMLYCAWTQFPSRGDRSAAGYVNGEIYASSSADHGLLWSRPINLTETNANGAQAGNCRSECWSSLASVVDDYLHISYVNDRDAGAVVQGEGQVTENDFVYHKVARAEIPSFPLQPGRDFHVGLPPELALPEDIDEDIQLVAVPGGDPAVHEFVIGNPADEGAGLWFALSVSEELEGLVSFDPQGGRLAAGAEQSIRVIFAPPAQGEFRGEIILSHNSPDAEANIAIGFNGLAAAGFGSLHGVVTAHTGGAPVPDATLHLTPGGYETVTDEEGSYRFDRIPAWDYTVETTSDDFLDSRTNVTVEVDEDANHRIELFFATFQPIDGGVDVSVSQDEIYESEIRIENNGDSRVDFRSSLIFPGGGNIEPFVQRLHLAAGNIVQDNRLCGVVFVEDHFFISGGDNNDGRGLIYMVDREGNLQGSFDQFMDSPWGMRDLTWDGRYIWGGDGRSLFRFDLSGNLIQTIQGPMNPCRNLAWDADREWLWVGDIRANIVAIAADGQVQRSYRQPDSTRLYGMGYYGGDPDGFDIYVVNSVEGHPNQFYKVNPENGQFRLVGDLPIGANMTAGGFEITTAYDPYSYVIVQSTNGAPDGVEIYQLDARTDWLSLAPLEGSIDPGSEGVATVTFDTHGMPLEQQFEATARFEHNGRGDAVELPISLTITAEGGVTRRNLHFSLGWNLVSLNIEPDEVDIPTLVQPLVESGLLLMVKDGAGRFYLPRINWDNLEDWNASEGYLVKVSQSAHLEVPGVGIAFNRPIALEQGWQAVSYYPRAEVPAQVGFAGIAGQLVIAKDGAGHFYLPAYEFSNMEPLAEGTGYYLKMTQDAELVYQLGRVADFQSPLRPTRFPEPLAGGENMSLLLTELPGSITEVAALNNAGDIVGSGAVDAAGRVGVAVWSGEDAGSLLQAGDEFTFVGWDGSESQPLAIEWLEGAARFETDGIAIGRASASEILPESFRIYEPFPNPFNSTTRIRFDLPERSSVKVALFDHQGRLVANLLDGETAAGRHTIALNAFDYASGVYIVRIETGHHRESVKALLVR